MAVPAGRTSAGSITRTMTPRTMGAALRAPITAGRTEEATMGRMVGPTEEATVGPMEVAGPMEVGRTGAEVVID